MYKRSDKLCFKLQKRLNQEKIKQKLLGIKIAIRVSSLKYLIQAVRNGIYLIFNIYRSSNRSFLKHVYSDNKIQNCRNYVEI